MQLRIYCFVVILEHQLIYLFSFSDRGTARGFQRDLPYGYELLGENLADISHLPFSHHSVGTLNRVDGRRLFFSAAPHSVAIAKSAHVGGFGLTEDIIKSEPAVFQSEWFPLPVECVPDAIEELPELRKDRYGNLTTVEEGDQPTNGDVMIKYEYCADGFDTSFIVQQVMVRTIIGMLQ